MPSCSEAPRGLFVQQRVTGIFTGSSISPSSWLRERSSRYAFRAGRNLPGKGLRYHRTVIVTAAVHPSLYRKLIPYKMEITSRFNLRALGTRRPLYFLLRVEQRPVFLLNSRLSHFCAPCSRRASFSLSYGRNLPSSSAMILSFTLVFSTHLPVSDCGTNARKISLEVFLGNIN